MSKEIFCLGDMHFSVSRDWDKESFEKFLDWFETFNPGKREDCELLQLGDIVETAQNLGDPIAMVTRFAVAALKKFSKIYIIVGNHCLKSGQYASKFLSSISPDIEVIADEKIITSPNGFRFIALPHKNTGLERLEHYYNNSLPEEYYKETFDFMSGHLAFKEGFLKGIDVDKFATRRYAFGHIHNRFGKYAKNYTGSIMPFKKGEEEEHYPRVIKVFKKENDDVSEREIELPKFRTFEYFEFDAEKKPEFKKNSDSVVHVYTVTGCQSKLDWKLNYQDYYIRDGEIDDVVLDTEGVDEETIKAELFDDYMTAFEKMIVEQELSINRGTLAIIKDKLANKKVF